MKVLLAINEKNDPVATARYLADRFGNTRLDLHVLSVIDKPELLTTIGRGNSLLENELERQAAHNRAICSMVADFAKQLRFAIKPRSASTHVEYGDPAEVVLRFARQLQVDLLLLGAPKRHGLLTAFRLEGVTRRVLRWADCPVELFRPAETGQPQRILVPFRISADRNFTLPKLSHLAMEEHCELQLLGIMSPVFDENCTEANPAAVLLRMQEARDSWAYARSRLAELSANLARELPQSVQVKHLLLQGDPVRELSKAACQLQPSLVVLDEQWVNQKSHLFSGFTPMSLVMSVNCSVISLGNRRNPLESLQLTGVSGLAY
jgi:nucleotide-binding universal stress UspA family protein